MKYNRLMWLAVAAGIAMFTIDYHLGITAADAIHPTPLGPLIWTPGSTVGYALAGYVIVQFIRGELTDELAE